MRTPVSPTSSKLPGFDPHEKPDRYKFKPKRQGIIGRMKESWMTQSQRTRWIKTAAIVFAIVTLFYFISPKGVEVYHEGTPSGGSSSSRSSLNNLMLTNRQLPSLLTQSTMDSHPRILLTAPIDAPSPSPRTSLSSSMFS